MNASQGIPAQRSRSLNELPFTDLYINLADATVASRFRADPTKARATGNIPVPTVFSGDVDEVRQLVNDRMESEGTITYKGIRLRYTRFLAAEGEMWAALRGVPLDLPSFETLRMNPKFVQAIKGWGSKKGLILVGGKTGNGKTTTCVAAIRDYLERIGGFAYTVEDPPEYQMQGAISERGFCLQNEIHDDANWSEVVKRAMRCRPDYLLLGEIRTPEAAEQLLKAATSGHLVLTTVHAGSVADALSSLAQLAGAKMGEKMARGIIADRLVACVYQELGQNGPTNTVLEPKRSDSNDRSVSIISSGDLNTLEGYEVKYPAAGG